MLDVFSSETPGSGEPGYFEKTSFVRASWYVRKINGCHRIKVAGLGDPRLHWDCGLSPR
jgi:hypothetical protein